MFKNKPHFSDPTYDRPKGISNCSNFLLIHNKRKKHAVDINYSCLKIIEKECVGFGSNLTIIGGFIVNIFFLF